MNTNEASPCCNNTLAAYLRQLLVHATTVGDWVFDSIAVPCFSEIE
jgi:hypothetical protein